MEREQLRKILARVKSGKLNVDQALKQLRSQPMADLGFATLDLQRARRRGFPEVVYGPGKTPQQLIGILGRMEQAGQTALVTRVEPGVAETVLDSRPGAVYHATPKALVLRSGRKARARAGVLVITAGTSDLPVAEEAALTAELMGNRVVRVFDVGVAGIHRLVAHREALLAARVIVAVAGMEGALPSIVAGLTDCPVIAVPTDIGYGTGEGGRAALLSMLNSCSSGLTVVNINNGFGAGYAAGMINRVGRRR